MKDLRIISDQTVIVNIINTISEVQITKRIQQT